MKPTEVFNEQCLSGEPLIMEFFGEVGSVRKVTIGNRFDNFVIVYPGSTETYQQTIEACFDFFRNHAVLLKQKELSSAWAQYKARNLI